MIKDKNNNLFLSSIKGTKPIKKSDKIKRPIPKQRTPSETTTELGNKNKVPAVEIKKIQKTVKEYKIENNKMNKKLKKGKVRANRTIDFHGHSINEAKNIFDNTINECFQSGFRCILFITGKGLKKDNKSDQKKDTLYKGKIREEFLYWAQEKKHSNKILNIQQAGIKHGGDGAFFVYLRKHKS